MNILYYFKDYDGFMAKWQYFHIIEELEREGHNIVVYNPLKYNSIDESNEQIIPFIKNSKIRFDLFLNCESDVFLYSSSIKAIKELGLPTALICFDNLHAPYIHRKMAPLFDVVWLTSIETKWLFEKWGCKNIVFQPYAANPYNFKPNWSSPTHSVSFIGSPYGSRINILNNLTGKGVKCDVYADKLSNHTKTRSKIPTPVKTPVYKELWQALSFDIGRKVLISALLNRSILKNKSTLSLNSNLEVHPSVSFQDMQSIYSDSALSLNITYLRHTYLLKNPLHKVHLRTFEIPMCGGLEIAAYSDELAGYFEDGKEIVLYKSDEEFISKAKFYLDPKNDSLSSEMKRNARKRAEEEHTWTKRFNVLFSNLNI